MTPGQRNFLAGVLVGILIGLGIAWYSTLHDRDREHTHTYEKPDTSLDAGYILR